MRPTSSPQCRITRRLNVSEGAWPNSQLITATGRKNEATAPVVASPVSSKIQAM